MHSVSVNARRVTQGGRRCRGPRGGSKGFALKFIAHGQRTATAPATGPGQPAMPPCRCRLSSTSVEAVGGQKCACLTRATRCGAGLALRLTFDCIKRRLAPEGQAVSRSQGASHPEASEARTSAAVACSSCLSNQRRRGGLDSVDFPYRTCMNSAVR